LAIRSASISLTAFALRIAVAVSRSPWIPGWNSDSTARSIPALSMASRRSASISGNRSAA